MCFGQDRTYWIRSKRFAHQIWHKRETKVRKEKKKIRRLANERIQKQCGRAKKIQERNVRNRSQKRAKKGRSGALHHLPLSFKDAP